jgi:hypothetical protein
MMPDAVAGLSVDLVEADFLGSDVAGYRATGQVTSERRSKPFQLARRAMNYSERYRVDSRRMG